MHHFDHAAVGEIAMLVEAAAHRQYRLELKPELLAVKYLRFFELVGKEPDVQLWSRQFHSRFLPRCALGTS